MNIVILGPTGVGKTKLSIELAKYFDMEIINGDSVQVYKGLDIGSGKITEEEKEGIVHHLLDIKSPDEEYSVKDYQDDIRSFLDKGDYIICGGTGLYISAALYDYEFEKETTTNGYEELSNEELYELCKKKDPNMDIHINNRKRLVRFLNKELKDTKPLTLLYPNTVFIGLTMPREMLYERINNRVDEMISDGLLKEVKSLYEKYPESRILHSAIGYKELIEYLNGNTTLDKAIDNIKQNSRHYAKRQYTWFNNKMKLKWFDVDINNFDKTVSDVIRYIKSK